MILKDRPMAVTNEVDFDKVIQSHQQLVTLIYATWCPFCLRFLPVFKKHAQSNGMVFLLAEDNQEILADQYEIDVIPTVLFFEKGTVTRRLDGVLGLGLTERQLVEFVKSADRK